MYLASEIKVKCIPHHYSIFQYENVRAERLYFLRFWSEDYFFNKGNDMEKQRMSFSTKLRDMTECSLKIVCAPAALMSD